jgi:hypothetical protein
MARHARLGVAEKLVSHARPQPVGAYQRAPLHAPAVLHVQGHAVAVLLEAQCLRQHVQLDVFLPLAGIEEHLVQVGTMDHAVEVASESLAKRRSAHRQPDHLLARQPVHHHHVVGVHRIALDRLGQPEQIEHAIDVRPELDAGADFLELRSLLEHPHLEALAAERESRGEAAYAAARDQHRKIFRHRFSSLSGPDRPRQGCAPRTA